VIDEQAIEQVPDLIERCPPHLLESDPQCRLPPPLYKAPFRDRVLLLTVTVPPELKMSPPEILDTVK